MPPSPRLFRLGSRVYTTVSSPEFILESCLCHPALRPYDWSSHAYLTRRSCKLSSRLQCTYSAPPPRPPFPQPRASPIPAHPIQAQTLPKVQTHAMNSDPVHPRGGQQAQRRSSPTPTKACSALHSSPKLSQWPARWKRMIDRQLPGEAAMSNQSRPRALLLNPPAPPQDPPKCHQNRTPITSEPQRGTLTRVRGSQTMIVHDPRSFIVNNPSWRSVMRRQLPHPGA